MGQPEPASLAFTLSNAGARYFEDRADLAQLNEVNWPAVNATLWRGEYKDGKHQGPYGPYAENLRHVLHAIEGHLVSGYADGGDAPEKQLELVPGAVEDSQAFLADHPKSRERFDRVADLVEGFESPFGLELLATTHWVIRHSSAIGADEVVTRVYEWSDRKKQFSRRQIDLARKTLIEKGWVS